MTDFCLWICIFAPRSLKLGLCSLWPDPVKAPLCFLFKLRALVNSDLPGDGPPDEGGHLWEVWILSTVVKELITAVLIWKTSGGPQEELSLASSGGGCGHSPGLGAGFGV